MARRNKSKRGQLKFRGFIGTSDGSGGTDLTVILSPETGTSENQNMLRCQDWLLRLKMQNELCDMVRNIRDACCRANGMSSACKSHLNSDRKKAPLTSREEASSLRSCIDESRESVRLIKAEGDRTRQSDGDVEGNGATRDIEAILPIPVSRSAKSIGKKVLTAVSDLLRTRHSKRSKVYDSPSDPDPRMQNSSCSHLSNKSLRTPSASIRKVKNHHSTKTATPGVIENGSCNDQELVPKSGAGRAHIRDRISLDATSGDSCQRVGSRKVRDPDPLDSRMINRNISASHCREEGKTEEKEFINYEDEEEVVLQFYASYDDAESAAPRHCTSSSTDEYNGTDTAGEVSPFSLELPGPCCLTHVGKAYSHSSGSVSECTPYSERNSIPMGIKCDTGHLVAGDNSVEVFLDKAKKLRDSGFQLLSFYMGSKNEYTPASLEESSAALNMDWQSKGSRHGVSVESSMVAGSTWQAVRAVSHMTSDKLSILQLLTDDSRMQKFDDMFDFAVPLIKVDERSAVRRLCFKPVWPTAPRDFLCYTAWTVLEDGSILVCSQSVPDSLLAVQKGYVRGRIVVSGYWIQPLNTLKSCDPFYNSLSPLGCKVTLAAHTELGGSLPASVINMLSTAAPLKIMAAVADLVRSDSI